MTVAASSLLFAVVFTVFVVAAVGIVVLTLRFTIGQARRSRATWLAGRAGRTDDEVEDDEDADEEEGDEEDEEEGMTALVLAGGSTRGAIQIGMLQVLAEHGFVPDRVYGSSVGAINGAGFAADPTAGRASSGWRRSGWASAARTSTPRGGCTDPGCTSSSGTPSTPTRASAGSSPRGSPTSGSRSRRFRSRWWRPR